MLPKFVVICIHGHSYCTLCLEMNMLTVFTPDKDLKVGMSLGDPRLIAQEYVPKVCRRRKRQKLRTDARLDRRCNGRKLGCRYAFVSNARRPLEIDPIGAQACQII